MARSYRLALLIAMALPVEVGLAGCSSIPGDHRMWSWLGNGTARLTRHVSNIPSEFDKGARRVNRLAGKVAGLPETVAHSPVSLVNSVESFASGEVGDLQRFPSALGGHIDDGADKFVGRIHKLTDPNTLLLTPNGLETTLARRRQRLSQVGSTLRLDRTMMPEPTDPERWTEVEPPPRRMSFLERILGRIRF